MPEKSRVKISFVAYLTIALIIVLGNSFLSGFGFHTEYTISRYIGLSAWSAILFALTGLFIFFHLLKFLKSVKSTHKMNLVWWILSLIVIFALIGVCLCPVGYFDETFGDFGTVSKIHRISAFIMFCTTIPMVFLTALKFRKKTSFFILSLIFVVYGLLFVAGYATSFPPFMNTILFTEAFFLIFFLILMLKIPSAPASTPEKLDK